jgi:two-component system sensor histidine kinase VicK
LTILPHGDTEDFVVLDGTQNAVKVIQLFYSRINNISNLLTDANGPQAILEVKEYREILENLVKRGVKRRLLTEITRDNLVYCKQLVNVLDLRHLDGIKGNFAVSENEYMASAILYKSTPVPQMIYSNAKAIVEQHQYLFDTLWKRAIPGERRITEMEQGIEPEFVEVIPDGKKTAELIMEFASSIKKDAQLVLPQAKTMKRIEKLGMWNHLIDAANRGAEIRVITPLTAENSNLAKTIIDNAPGIKILAGPPSSAGLFIQDEDRYLRAEDKDPDAIEVSDAISVAIYSNSRNGVKSFKSFFETLWKQSQLYEELKAAKEKLELQDKMQREFINIAAHELRTPIQPILGMAGIVESMLNEDKEVRITKDDVALIIRNANRLERLSSDILEVARIESGILQLNKQRFNIRDVIIAAVKDLKKQDLIGERDNKVSIDCNLKDMFVFADREKISQVISNFLTNATKFTKEGVIAIVCQREGDRAVVSVRDTGTGIDADIMPRLFTKFATKSERGTGLGLYISKNIIEAHGGKIWAKNNDGKGATFAFKLPIESENHIA